MYLKELDMVMFSYFSLHSPNYSIPFLLSNLVIVIFLEINVVPVQKVIMVLLSVKWGFFISGNVVVTG